MWTPSPFTGNVRVLLLWQACPAGQSVGTGGVAAGHGGGGRGLQWAPRAEEGGSRGTAHMSESPSKVRHPRGGTSSGVDKNHFPSTIKVEQEQCRHNQLPSDNCQSGVAVYLGGLEPGAEMRWAWLKLILSVEKSSLHASLAGLLVCSAFLNEI